MARTEEEFARRFMLYTLTGNEGMLTTAGSTIEPDGRRRAAAVKRYLAEGYITKTTKEEKSERYTITPLAYTQVVAVKPTFVTEPRPYDFEVRPGVLFMNQYDKASEELQKQKYIIENPGEYLFFLWDAYQKKSIGDPVSPRDKEAVATALFGPDSSRRMLLVTDRAYTAARDAAVFNKKLDFVRSMNLPWGLEKLGLIDDDNETAGKVFQVSVGGGFPGMDRAVFHLDASKWEAEAAAAITRYARQIEEAEAAMAILKDMQTRMETFGGWGKFLAEYEKLCVAFVEKKEKA